MKWVAFRTLLEAAVLLSDETLEITWASSENGLSRFDPLTQPSLCDPYFGEVALE